MTQPTHIEPADLGEADRTLKTKLRPMWAAGNYPAVVNRYRLRAGPDSGSSGRDQVG